jgi:hypothetical protein
LSSEPIHRRLASCRSGDAMQDIKYSKALSLLASGEGGRTLLLT